MSNKSFDDGGHLEDWYLIRQKIAYQRVRISTLFDCIKSLQDILVQENVKMDELRIAELKS